MSIHVSGDAIVSHIPVNLYHEQELARQVGIGKNGANLHFLSDAAYVKDSGTPANDFFDRIRDLLTVTNTVKLVTGPDGNLRYQAHNLWTQSENWSSAADSYGPANCSVLGNAITISADEAYEYKSAPATAGFDYKVRAYVECDTTQTNVGFRIADDGGEIDDLIVDFVADVPQWIELSGTHTTGANIQFGPDNRGAVVSGATNDSGFVLTIHKVHVFRTPADETYVATTSSAKFGLAFDHDVLTLDASSTSVNVGTGKRTFTLGGSTDYRTATTAWADATAYAIGDKRHVANRSYTCTAAHTSASGSQPGVGSLWKVYWKRDEKWLRLSDQADIDGRCAWGRVDYQNGTTLVVDVVRVEGSGACSSWHIIECKGVLIEEARTNLAPYSKVSASHYTSEDINITTGISDPFGGTDAVKIAGSGGAAVHGIYATNSIVLTAANHTHVYMLKDAGDGVYPQLRALYEGAGFAWVNFDWDGNVGNYGGTNLIDAGSVPLGNGYRAFYIVINHTSGTRGSQLRLITNPATDTESPSLDIDGLGYYVATYDVQLGSFPTSHIATNGAAVARYADDLTLATSKYPHNASEGTFAVDAIIGHDTNARIFELSGGSGLTRLMDVYYDGIWFAQYGYSATTPMLINTAYAPSANDNIRHSGAYKENDAASSLNGAIATDASFTPLQTATTLYIGKNNGGVQLNGHLRQLIYIPIRETNAQLQARAA